MKLASTMIVALVLGCVAAQQGVGAASALERAGLSGPVARVSTAEEYEDAPRRVRSEVRYDAAGLPVEAVSYAYDFRDATLRSRTVTHYDAGLRLVRETFDAAGTVVSTNLFRYDQHDRLVEEIAYDAAGAVTARHTYTHDPGGNLVLHESYRGAALYRTHVWTYAPDGGLRTHEVFDGAGALVSTSTHAADGLSYEQTEYDEAGTIVRRSAAELDARGNLLEALEFDAGGAVVERSTFRYDERGLLLEDVWETDLTDRPWSVVVEYAYEFDAHGNWTVRRMIEFGDVVETLYRTIEYH